MGFAKDLASSCFLSAAVDWTWKFVSFAFRFLNRDATVSRFYENRPPYITRITSCESFHWFCLVPLPLICGAREVVCHLEAQKCLGTIVWFLNEIGTGPFFVYIDAFYTSVLFTWGFLLFGDIAELKWRFCDRRSAQPFFRRFGVEMQYLTRIKKVSQKYRIKKIDLLSQSSPFLPKSKFAAPKFGICFSFK